MIDCPSPSLSFSLSLSLSFSLVYLRFPSSCFLFLTCFLSTPSSPSLSSPFQVRKYVVFHEVFNGLVVTPCLPLPLSSYSPSLFPIPSVTTAYLHSHLPILDYMHRSQVYDACTHQVLFFHRCSEVLPAALYGQSPASAIP